MALQVKRYDLGLIPRTQKGVGGSPRPTEDRGRREISGTEATDGSKVPRTHWKSNSGPREERPVFLTIYSVIKTESLGGPA